MYISVNVLTAVAHAVVWSREETETDEASNQQPAVASLVGSALERQTGGVSGYPPNSQLQQPAMVSPVGLAPEKQFPTGEGELSTKPPSKESPLDVVLRWAQHRRKTHWFAGFPSVTRRGKQLAW